MKRNGEFLRDLSEAKSRAKCKRVLQKAGKKEIIALAEVAKNVLHNRLKIPPGKKRTLCDAKRAIRQIASRLTNCNNKKKIVQRGGFPVIAGILASTAVPYIIESIIKSRAKQNGKQNRKTGSGPRRRRSTSKHSGR
jgi:hypothetical protein